MRLAIAVTAVAALVGIASPAFAKRELIFIGMHGPKIHAARFDPKAGTIDALGPVADNPRPTWAVRHPKLPVVYFVNQGGGESKIEGTVQAFRVNRKTGALSKFSEMRTGAGGATHLAIDARSMTMFVANFDGAVSSLPINRDGGLGAPVSIVAVIGSGPHRRQASAHAHGLAVDRGANHVLVADLGADRVWVLPFDVTTRNLGPYDPAGPRHYVAAAGSGPRHLVFHPNGRSVYLVNELTASVDVLRWDAKAATLSKLQTISTDDPAFTGTKSAAEIAISKDGRFVYVSNRGDHMLVVFAVDRGSGTLSLVQRISSGGNLPWHFEIHPSGKWLISANRDADALSLFAIDRATGKLTDTGTKLASPDPVHVHFSGL